MSSTTTPDNIVVWTTADPTSVVAESQTQATSIQAAFDKRQRYDFVWDDSADRTAQTGMVQGSRGYQIDTATEYMYDNSNWRLFTPHIEFTASKGSFANGVVTLVGNFSLDNTPTTDANLAVPGGDGIITIARPGLYAVSSLSRMNSTGSNPATGRTFLDFALSSDDSALVQRVSIATGEDTGSITMPNLRITAANTDCYFKIYRTVATTSIAVNTRVRITRIG